MIFPNEKQKITMVTGKGGVGKSTVAAALAQKYANAGQKTLLVELGEHSYFTHIYGQNIGYEPTEIGRNFSVALWGGESCLKEYVLHLIRVKRIVDLFFNNKVMRTFIRAAPALKELAMLGKITSGVRAWGPPLVFDHIVVDGFATGHFLALLKAPVGMSELIEFGPMGEQSRNIIKVLSKANICQYVVATLPEELPVSESIELIRDIQVITGLTSEVYCNKIYRGNLLSADFVGAEPTAFVDFYKNYLRRQQEQIETLKKISEDTKMLSFVFAPNGKEVISHLAKELA